MTSVHVTDSTRMLVLYRVAFSLDMALSFACTRSHSHDLIFVSRALIAYWSMFEFLTRDFPKTFYTEFIAVSSQYTRPLPPQRLVLSG